MASKGQKRKDKDRIVLKTGAPTGLMITAGPDGMVSAM